MDPGGAGLVDIGMSPHVNRGALTSTVWVGLGSPPSDVRVS